MKKSYLFYGAVAAVVAIDYLIGNVGTDTAQVLIEVAPVEPEKAEPIKTASEEIEMMIGIAFGITIVPVALKIIKMLMMP